MGLSSRDLHGLLLVKDCVEGDGAVVLAHLFKLILGIESHHRLVLVAMRHTSAHYSLVLRKLGLNVAALATAGRLLVVDALRAGRGHHHSALNLKDLHAAVALSCSPEGPPTCLVYDDLTALQCMAGNATEWPAFLRSAVCASPAVVRCCVAVARWDVAADEEWVLRLEHRAATVVDVGPLKSAEGGKLHVARRMAETPREKQPDSPSGELLLGPEELYYSLTEGAVRFRA